MPGIHDHDHNHNHDPYHYPPGRPRPPWSWDPTRRGGPDPSMRVSDAERTEVTNALCHHFGDGRLDEAELNDRLARATAAKTRADLAPLLADLPRHEVAPPEGTRTRRRHPATVALVVLVVVALTWSIVGAATHLVFLRVPWLLILVAVLVLRRGRRYRHRHF